MDPESKQPPAGQTPRQSMGQAIVDWLAPVVLAAEIIERVTGIWHSWM